MKTKIKTIGLSALLGVALLGSSASADILLSAPGIPLISLPPSYTRSDKETPMLSGEFYEYRVLGVYSTLRIESGPWNQVSSDSILMGLVDGVVKPIAPMLVKSYVKINGEIVGEVNEFSTNSKNKLVQTYDQLQLNKDIIKKDTKAKKVHITVCTVAPEGVTVSGHVGIKAQYIPANIRARGSVRVGQFMGDQQPRLHWNLIKFGQVDSFDPGARLAVELPQEESPKVAGAVVADDSVTVIGKSNMSTNEVVPSKARLGLGGGQPVVIDPTK